MKRKRNFLQSTIPPYNFRSNQTKPIISTCNTNLCSGRTFTGLELLELGGEQTTVCVWPTGKLSAATNCIPIASASSISKIWVCCCCCCCWYSWFSSWRTCSSNNSLKPLSLSSCLFNSFGVSDELTDTVNKPTLSGDIDPRPWSEI